MYNRSSTCITYHLTILSLYVSYSHAKCHYLSYTMPLSHVYTDMCYNFTPLPLNININAVTCQPSILHIIHEIWAIFPLYKSYLNELAFLVDCVYYRHSCTSQNVQIL